MASGSEPSAVPPSATRALLDHWIYGVTPDRGYGTRGTSARLNLALYAARLEGHLTPLRGETTQDMGATVDVVMLHPGPGPGEVLLSRVTPSVPDELGRPTFADHTAVVPVALLSSARLRLEDVARALATFDAASPQASGTLPDLEVELSPPPTGEPPWGQGLARHMSPAAAETLLSRLLSDPRAPTLVLARESTLPARRELLFLLAEALHLGGPIPFLTSVSDGPPSSVLHYFQLVISPRGLRADNAWILLDASLDRPLLPRVPGHDGDYARLSRCFDAPLHVA